MAQGFGRWCGFDAGFFVGLEFLFVAGFGSGGFYFFGFCEHSIEAAVLAHGPLARVLFHFFFGEPAAVGEVGGGFGERCAVAFAVLLIHIFGGGPLGLEGVVGAAVGFARADPVAFLVHEEVEDGFLDGRGFVGGFGARGFGQAEAGDLEDAGGGAGDGGIEFAVQEGRQDFGAHEGDGGVVLEQGDDDAAGPGEFAGAAFEVGDAVVVAFHGGLAALDAVDLEGAAAAWSGPVGIVGVEGLGFLGFGFCFVSGHRGLHAAVRELQANDPTLARGKCAAHQNGAPGFVLDSRAEIEKAPRLAELFSFSYPISLGYQVWI